ncbi:MAG: hypothetical protein Q9177_003213, partial [Variospora cf. flavescens]
MPAIPASTASRSKLKASQFQGHEVPSDDTTTTVTDNCEELDKENNGPSENYSNMASSQLMLGPQPLSQPSQHKECPQTPIGRLPLAELIAAVGDSANHNLNLTPGERVLWQHVPGSSQFSSSQPATTSKTGKKRARSSSPSSSSQTETSNHFHTKKKQPLDLQTLQKTLKTPHADPAADLWAKYSSKTVGIRDGSPTRNETSFAEILPSSSPQTPGSHLKTRELKGLRRSISCANEWPTSAGKRRRLNRGSSQHQASKDLLPEKTESAKMSRVSLLVEQVQKALLRNRAADCKSAPRVESSPLPDKGAATHLIQSSSNDGTQVHNKLDEKSPAQVFPQTVVTQAHTFQHDHAEVVEEAGDFEEDLDDDDLLEAVDASLAPPKPTHTISMNNVLQSGAARQMLVSQSPTAYKTSTKPSTKGERFPSAPSNSNSMVSMHSKASVVPRSDYVDDDEDNEDMSAADFDHIVAVYDQKQRDIPEKNGQTSVPQGISRKPLAQLCQPSVPVARAGERTGPRKAQVIDVSSDEEFGDDADFEDIVAQCTATSQPSSQKPSIKQRRTIQRYQIIKVVEGNYMTDNGISRPEKVLVVQSETSKITKAITLRQSWVHSECLPDTFLHLVGKFDATGQCIVDDRCNLLILHPDHLVSATVVGDSFSCIRRAVLQDRVKATNDSNESQVYGHILHEIFQEAMKSNRWDDEWLSKTIEEIASRYLESFFEINVDPIKAMEQLKAKSVALQSWAQIFVSARAKPGAIIKDRNGATSTVGVNKLLEVEEKVWSPMYGLKGNVDATIQITTSNGSEEKTLTVPFELKTGKHANEAHRAQTALYTLLLSDRYDIDVACGILYYMESSEISRIPAIRHELMHMVMKRNELASYIRQRVKLPPMLKSPHLCGKCYAQKPCFVYHKLVEHGDGETSGLKEKFEEVIRHLKPSHADFFQKWDDLLSKEERDV